MKWAKRRYLLLQIDIDGPLSEQELLGEIWNSITEMYGEYGASLANLSLICYDETKKKAIVRVGLVALQPLRASLALITRIADREAAVNLIQVSGTIKSLRETMKK